MESLSCYRNGHSTFRVRATLQSDFGHVHDVACSGGVVFSKLDAEQGKFLPVTNGRMAE